MSGATPTSYNTRNSGVKRLLQEAREMENDRDRWWSSCKAIPANDGDGDANVGDDGSDDGEGKNNGKGKMKVVIGKEGTGGEFWAEPLEDNLYEWHFTVKGPSDSEFEGGIYHGRVVLPPEYPFRPPSIMLLTPTGRFEVGKKICLSITGFHEEMWQPAWGIRTALIGLISFFTSDPKGAVGSLEASPAERRRLAKLSRSWACPTCGKTNSESLPDIPPSISHSHPSIDLQSSSVSSSSSSLTRLHLSSHLPSSPTSTVMAISSNPSTTVTPPTPEPLPPSQQALAFGSGVQPDHSDSRPVSTPVMATTSAAPIQIPAHSISSDSEGDRSPTTSDGGGGINNGPFATSAFGTASTLNITRNKSPEANGSGALRQTSASSSPPNRVTPSPSPTRGPNPHNWIPSSTSSQQSVQSQASGSSLTVDAALSERGDRNHHRSNGTGTSLRRPATGGGSSRSHSRSPAVTTPGPTRMTVTSGTLPSTNSNNNNTNNNNTNLTSPSSRPPSLPPIRSADLERASTDPSLSLEVAQRIYGPNAGVTSSSPNPDNNNPPGGAGGGAGTAMLVVQGGRGRGLVAEGMGGTGMGGVGGPPKWMDRMIVLVLAAILGLVVRRVA